MCCKQRLQGHIACTWVTCKYHGNQRLSPSAQIMSVTFISTLLYSDVKEGQMV